MCGMAAEDVRERTAEDVSGKWMELPVTVISAEGGGRISSRPLLMEHELDIFVDGQRHYSLRCTRMSLRELVFGRLYGDGFIENREDVEELIFQEEESKAFVRLRRGNRETEKAKGSGEKEEREETEGTEEKEGEDQKVKRGTESKKAEEKKKSKMRILRPEEVFSLSRAFLEHGGLYGKVGSVHTCLLRCQRGGREETFVFEDMGRHHAADKAIGFALMENISLPESILFTSGRVPLDVVQKAVRAGVFALISKSLPTKEAVEEARREHLLLICRAWPDSFEIYADPEGQMAYEDREQQGIYADREAQGRREMT